MPKGKNLRGKVPKVLAAALAVLVALLAANYRSDLSIERLDRMGYKTGVIETVTIRDASGGPASIDVHYTDSHPQDGARKVVVLLHGMFSSSHTFAPWTASLVQDGYRVIAIDQPNHGLTGGFSDGKTGTQRTAALVKAVLDAKRISACVIGGNSMGGGVGWYFAARYHDPRGDRGLAFRVDGLVLIDAAYASPAASPVASPPSGGSRSGAGGVMGAVKLLRTTGLGGFLSKFTPRWLMGAVLKGAYGDAKNIAEPTLDRYYFLLRKAGNRRAVVYRDDEPDAWQATAQDKLDRIKDAGIPVLVMWGMKDSWIPVKTADSIQRDLALDDASVKKYAGLGHVPMEEDPTRTYADLRAFLKDRVYAR
jgi:pimeloyl-ACP methyl ester carboxylesterase